MELALGRSVVGSGPAVTAGHWCVDGSFVAIRSPAIHPPRYDNLHHGERDGLRLRGRHGKAGQGPVHDSTRSTANAIPFAVVKIIVPRRMNCWRTYRNKRSI